MIKAPDRLPRVRLTVRSGSNLAFAVIMLTSLLAMFSSTRKDITLMEIGVIVSLGMAYIAIGTYGYDFVGGKTSLLFHLVYFAIQVPIGSLVIYYGKGAGFNQLILLPLVGQAVVLFTGGWVFAIEIALLAAYSLANYLYSYNWVTIWSSLPIFLAGVIFIMVFTQMAVEEEKARTKVERLVEELERANKHLGDYAVQAEELAITRERNRLAREIHDGLGHYLTTIHMQIQAARAVMAPGNTQAQEALKTAQNMAQEALVDVRQSVASLRAPAHADRPVDESIRQLIEDCLASDIHTELNVVGAQRQLSPQARLTIYRTVQEGLNNIRKHAQAGRVSIVLDYSDEQRVRLNISDDGQGAESLDGGFGLLGIQERARLLGGELQTRTSPGAGFSLEMTLPG